MLLQAFKQVAELLKLNPQALLGRAGSDPSVYRRELEHQVYGKLAAQKQGTSLIMGSTTGTELLEDYLHGGLLNA